MTFYVDAQLGCSITVYCFDVEPALQAQIVRSLLPVASTVDLSVLLSIQQAILQGLVSWFDDAVWRVRDFVRSVEKGRQGSQLYNTDFVYLHDLARHTIHTVECTEIATDMTNQLFNSAESMARSDPSNEVNQHVAMIAFWASKLKNIHRRAQAVEKRLLNEINLSENKASKNISLAMQRDSSAMKTIAIVTLVLLPPTFVSVSRSTDI
ncbi:hypothetical protein MMC25_006378 [Agyrium rufum]|nr:hypothetical protein [Agyrium rufum]